MDALFALLFAVYMIVSIAGAFTRARRGVQRGAGAPWPSLPPAPPTEPVPSPPSAPSGPLAAAPDVDAGGPRASEDGATEGTWAEDAGTEGLEGEAPGGEGVGAESQQDSEWESLEGESLEWAEDAGAGGAESGPAPAAAGGAPRAAGGTSEAAVALATAARLSMRLSGADLARAIVASEILGPPRALCRAPRPGGPPGSAGASRR